MGLETGNYISALVKTNPLSSDNVSEGDDHLQLIKKILKQNFPVGTDSVGPDQVVQVLIAKSSAPTVDTSASGHAARAMGLLWLDTTNNVLKIRNQANDAWVTLAIDPETSNSVDINAGTIDGAAIGGATPAAGDFTDVTTTGTLVVGTDITISGDDIKMATNTDAYMLVADGTEYSPVAISGDITITNAGVTSIGADKVVTAKVLDGNITNAKLADMAANTIKVRNANSSGVPSDVALATTELLIGDGTGFTAASLSGDATMTNAGAVTVAKIQGTAVSSTAPTNDQYMKYSSASSEWQMVSITGTDKLTTKGDLLVYNTVDSETRLPVGANDLVLTADSTATNGVDWAAVSVPDDSITLAKLEDGTQGDVLYYGASGAPARLGFGTSGYFLKTQGTGADPIWAAESDTTYTAGDGLDLSGTEFSTDLLANGGLEIQSTELSVAQGISQYDVAQFASGVADNDFLKIDGTSVEGRSATELLSDVSSIDNSWTGSQRATAVTDNDGSYDMDLGQNFITTPSGATTITFTNITDGQSGFIKLINSGGETISLHANTKGDANIATTVTTAGTYLLSYFSDGTDVWLTNSAIYA
jgi:hypothetical protein